VRASTIIGWTIGVGLLGSCGDETGPPKAPSNLSVQLLPGPVVTLDWKDNSANEMTFVIERAANGGAFSVLAMPMKNAQKHNDGTVVPDNDYAYRIAAVNADGQSDFSEEKSVNVPKN
jgi:hypothetical protein